MKDLIAKEGMRIKMLSMVDDPNPIPKDTEGTIRLIDDAGIIHVIWDNGRNLGVIPGVDKYLLEPSNTEDIFNDLIEDSSGAQQIKSSIKKTPSVVKKSMGSMPSVKNAKTNLNFKSSGIKDVKAESEKEVKVKKNPKDKKVKTEMTGAGGTATGSVSSSGAYVGPVGATKRTFGSGPLTSKGVAKPGPLKKENIFTKKDLIEEITNSKDATSFDDTRFEAWSDKNRDGWKWNDDPAYHKDGEIVDLLAKIDSTWDDNNLDISKEWDKTQNITKEDFLRIVKNRINESKKVKSHVEDEEQIDEMTTFGSVWGSNGPPVGPAFAAKKGQWRTGKKPIWKGGTIVQQVENSGVLNPTVNESNDVKWVKGGSYVKVKKKCTKFPYCSQGAVDNPLKVSEKSDEIGTYVEDFMKNVHEVAKETGRSFTEVYNIVKNNLKD